MGDEMLKASCLLHLHMSFAALCAILGFPDCGQRSTVGRRHTLFGFGASLMQESGLLGRPFTFGGL